jgi:hypothetical protein
MTNPPNKPSLILWLIGQLLLVKIPVCFMFMAIIYFLGCPWEYAAVIGIVLGHYVTVWYDDLNDEVTLYIDKKISKEVE